MSRVYSREIIKTHKITYRNSSEREERTPLYLEFEEASIENHSGNIVSWWESRRGRFNKYKAFKRRTSTDPALGSGFNLTCKT